MLLPKRMARSHAAGRRTPLPTYAACRFSNHCKPRHFRSGPAFVRPVVAPRTRTWLKAPQAAASSIAGFPDTPSSGMSDGIREALATVRKESTWLRQFQPFSNLTEGAVEDLLLAVDEALYKAGDTMVTAEAPAESLIIIRKGTVRDIPGPSTPPSAMPGDVAGGIHCETGPGAVFNFQELLLERAPSCSLEAVSDVVAWTVPRDVFTRVAMRHSDVMRQLTQQISSQLLATQEAVQEEKARARALQPFLAPNPRRGIIGSSKYADRLRRQIIQAAKDPARATVMIFGEPGLEKDNIAALVHYGSRDRGQPLLRLECERPDWTIDLLGRGLKRGLLYWLGGGTLLLNNVHKANGEQLQLVGELLQAVAAYPEPLQGSSLRLSARPRILMTSELRVPALDALAFTIPVPPLRVRPGDIAEYQRYFLALIARRKGEDVKLALTTEALQALQAYSFPNNLQELESLVERAVVQAVQPSKGVVSKAGAPLPAAAGSPAKKNEALLSEDVFWFAAESKDRFRWNLLTAYPELRSFLRSAWWPELINMRVVAPAFALVVGLLFLGPQDRAHNFALTAFWGYWWPLMFIAYPFLGRIWCSVCPFMIYGEIVQRWRLSQGAQLLKWPRAVADKYGAWFLWALFAGILVWEEVWDLPDNAALSSWLLLLITGGAVACSLVFEKRLWCRHLCPIGGMNGLFAKLAVTELRARQGVCSGNCTSYSCFKGGPEEPPEALASDGCPLMSHPAQLTDNRNCVLCMECLKACNHRSVQLRLRPPGIDLWTSHKPSASELSLMFILLGAVYLHHLPQLLDQFHLDPALLLLPRTPHMATSLAILLAPGLLAWGAHTAGSLAAASSRPAYRAPSFEVLAYGYLPLVWGGTLAHYLQMFLAEAGHILPVAALTFSLGSVAPLLPSAEAPPDVIAFLQGTTLLAGAGLSLLLSKRIAMQPWSALRPQAACVALFTAELWHLIV